MRGKGGKRMSSIDTVFVVMEGRFRIVNLHPLPTNGVSLKPVYTTVVQHIKLCYSSSIHRQASMLYMLCCLAGDGHWCWLVVVVGNCLG